MLEAVKNMFFPRRCPACRTTLWSGDWCPECTPLVEDVGPFVCRTCGRQLAAADRQRCLGCLKEPEVYASMRAAYVYGGPVADAVLALKYSDRRANAEPLALQMVQLLSPTLQLLPDFIVPVPLHRARLTSRKYNQAALLAHHVAAALGRRVVYALTRNRDTGDQGGLNAQERLENVKGAFSLSGNAARVEGKHILLVDDVITTGATTTECARTLLAGNAAQVDIWAVARPES